MEYPHKQDEPHTMATHAPRPSPGQDWHPADIVASLRKAGWSLRRLSMHHGYVPTQLAAAVQRPWTKGEQMIADAIGVPAEVIWPSRYANRAERQARLSQRPRANRARRPARPSTTSLDGADQSANLGDRGHA